MSALATEYKAINLGQGFPDYPMDEALSEAVAKAMRDGHNQYAPMPGHLPLREAIASKVKKLYGTPIDPVNEITITPGGTYAIYSAVTAVIRPGDEVIVFEPAYDSYIPNVEINGGIPIRIRLTYPDYSIDWNKVKESITPRTRMIMINTPHNPTGSVLSHEDMLQLQEVVKDTNIIIVSDEVYEHLIFGGKQHQSVLRYPELFKRSFVSFSPELFKRSFVSFSFGKVYNCTGWKLGYSISPAAFTSEFRKVHQFNCFSCHTPMQVALAGFLQHEDAYLNLGTILEKKQQFFKAMMETTPLKPLPTFGSYFQLYSYQGLTDETEAELAIRLTKEAGVASIPVSAFYADGTDNKVLRFCFAKKEDTLAEAANRLARYFG
ncbi:MAG: methionine aminotransferase [Chitinophagaceae bacterium]|nr:methionine aminotransferase [Chitinophagaceae bacterium]